MTLLTVMFFGAQYSRVPSRPGQGPLCTGSYLDTIPGKREN